MVKLYVYKQKPSNWWRAPWRTLFWDIFVMTFSTCIMQHVFKKALTVEKCFSSTKRVFDIYRKTSNISRTLVGNTIFYHWDVVGASPVGAAPTTSSFSTEHLVLVDWAKTMTRWDEIHLNFGIWCDLNWRFCGICILHFSHGLSRPPSRKYVCRGQWSSVRRPRWQQRLYDSDGGSLEERSFLWHYIWCRGGEGTVRSPYNAAINSLGAKSLWRIYTDIFVVYKISFLDIEISQVCEVHLYEHQQPWRWIEIKSQKSLCFGQIGIH